MLLTRCYLENFCVSVSGDYPCCTSAIGCYILDFSGRLQDLASAILSCSLVFDGHLGRLGTGLHQLHSSCQMVLPGSLGGQFLMAAGAHAGLFLVLRHSTSPTAVEREKKRASSR